MYILYYYIFYIKREYDFHERLYTHFKYCFNNRILFRSHNIISSRSGEIRFECVVDGRGGGTFTRLYLLPAYM